MTDRIPTGLKGAVLRATAAAPVPTLDGVLLELTPPRPAFEGPILNSDDWRRRRVAVAVYELAADYWRESQRSRVSRALGRLAHEGWLQSGAVTLTPYARRLLQNRSPAEVVSYVVARGRTEGRHAQASQWPLDRIAAALEAVQAGATSRQRIHEALGGDGPVSGTTKRALSHGRALSLWTLPSERALTLRARRALGLQGNDWARVGQMEAA